MAEPIKEQMNPEVTTDHSGVVLPDVTVDRVEESTIVGEYELISEIARGGMGVVYRARQQSLDREVALKLILSGDEASSSEIDRFMVEARASARLDHPYIVPIYDIGTFEGRPFFSMGFVNGPSLSARLSKSGPIAPFEAAQIMSKVALAIEYAHTQGIIHRDLKPGNILLESSGDPKVTDFGLAKRLDSGESITATGQVLGTPSYMAPEQASGAEVGPGADIYSLGATLYAMLIGRPPFQAPNIHEMLLKLMEETPATPSSLNAGIPSALDQICLKCLQKSPGDRYPSARALAEDLERFLRGESLTPIKARSKTKLFAGIGIAASILIGLGIYFSVGKEPKVDTALVAITPVEVEKPKVDPLAGLSETERLLVQSLESALDAGLPDLKGDPWKYRHEETAKQFEKVFKDYGWDVLSVEPEVLAAKLKGKPAILKESILEGLERWEMAAIASKQTTIETLRNLQMQLDTADWRKTMRLLRGDGLNQAWLDQLQVVIEKEKLTPAQIEGMGYQVWLASPTRGEPLIGILKKLQAKSSESFWLSSALVSELMTTGKATPAKTITYGNEAVSLLKQLELEKSKSAIIHKQIAAAYLSIGNTKAAEEATAKVEEFAYPEAFKHLQLARQLRKENKLPEAVAEAQQAVLKGNDWPIAHATLGIIQRAGGQTAPSEASFKKAIELCATEVAAIDLMRKVFTWDAGKPPIRNRLQEMFASERLEAEILRRVCKYRPDVTIPTLNELYNRLHFPDQWQESNSVAEQMYKVASTDADKKVAISVYVSALVRSGQPDSIVAPILRQAEEMNVPLPRQLQVHSFRFGEIQKGIDSGIAFYGIGQNTKAPASSRLRQALTGTDWIEAGISQFESLAAENPEDPWLSAMIGILQLQMGRGEQSEISLAKSLSRVLPETPPSRLFFLATDFLQAGRIGEALRLAFYQCERESRTGPYKGWPYGSLGNIFLRTGDIETSAYLAESLVADAFERLLTVENLSQGGGHPQGSLILSMRSLARVQMQLGNFKLAADNLREAYNADPYDFQNYPYPGLFTGYGSDYAQALLLSGDVTEAEKVSKEIVGFRPEQAIARRVYGQVLHAKGQLPEAIANLKLAAKLDPFDGLSEFHLGKAFLIKGELEPAVEAFEKSIKAYHRRWIRDFAPVPLDSALSLLNALNQKSVEAIPADKRLLLQQKAFEWLKADLVEWRKKAEGNVNFEYSAAASVLDRLLKNESIKDAKLLASLPPNLKKQWGAVWDEAEAIRQIAEPKRAKLPKDPMEWLWPLSRELEVAEWVIKKGGMVRIQAGTATTLIGEANKLPGTAFRITGISLSNRPISDLDLDQLEGLLAVTEVQLDGTLVTDAGIRKLTHSAPLLSKVNLNGTKVTNAALDQLSNLTEISITGTGVTSEKVVALRKDQSGPLILHEFTAVPPKHLGAMLQFDGSTTSVDLPFHYVTGQPITYELTFRPAPGFASLGRLISTRGPNENELCLQYNEFGSAHSSVLCAGNNWFNTYNKNPRDKLISNKESTLATTFDGSTLRTFVDGKLVGQVQPNGIIPGLKSNPICIGRNAAAKAIYIRGTIREVRISSTCRYTKDYKLVDRFEPDADTLGLYHLDEGEGDIAKDSSGKNNHGKIINGKWIREGKAK
jgi:serine/threonine protein kinase/tetratricopeptide (TPR) repeat protein